MEEKLDKKIIGDVISGIFSAMEKEHADLFKPIIESSKFDLSQIGDFEIFYLKFVYSYSNFLDVLIENCISKNKDVKFIFKHSDFIEAHYQRIIQKKEGSACCADKSRTIMNKLINWVLTGEEIVFDYEQKYTFHLPSEVFTNHLDIVNFYNGLKHLYYGNPEEYMKILLSIYKKS